MINEYEKSINQIKENLDKAKGLKIRAEARLEQLNKQKQDILAEIESMGVKPEELENEIERLKTEIEDLIKTANELLPMDLIKNS
jgi:cell division septum initiation protein DivIVA